MFILNEITDFTKETISVIGDEVLLMVFSMFLNTYSIETINKIQSSITEHSTVQEIQKLS